MNKITFQQVKKGLPSIEQKYKVFVDGVKSDHCCLFSGTTSLALLLSRSWIKGLNFRLIY